MVSFRGKKRKKKYEDEDRYEEEEPRRKRIKRKSSQSRRRPKEPIKPWGRKERLLVLALLLLTTGTSAVLAVSSRAWKLPGLPRVKIPSISIPFFGQEKIVIEADKERARDREKAEEVIDKFREATRELSGVYGLYIMQLDSGFSYGENDVDTFGPASLNKLPVMLAMYVEAERGSLSLSDKYKLKSSDKVSGSGSLSGKPAGFELTYRDLVRYMGKESDNTAFNIAKNILGEEKIQKVIDEIGMGETVIFGEEQKTTPYEIGLLFQKLWGGKVVSPESRDEIIRYLIDTNFEEWLAARIPPEVEVAHKFGRELHVVNDAGIVFTDSPYVIVIMSKGVVEREADEIFPYLSRMIYESLTSE